MLFLIALILAIGFTYFCHKPLKAHKNIFYICAVVISVVVATVNFRGLPSFVTNYVIALFSRGALATALWCVVMWAGAFPNGSKPIKTIMPVRGELSIFTAILTLGHNIGYGKTYFARLFTDAQSMSTNQLVASILTIIMLLIMIPLTIMSFPSVRRKFDPKTWKKIQRLAYVFYGLIYTHIMVLCIPQARLGRSGYRFTIVMYSLVFIGYAVFRVKKYLTVRKTLNDGTKTNTISALTTLVLSVIIVLGARPTSAVTNDQSSEPVETTIPVTTTTATTTAVTTTAITTSQTDITTTTTEISETSETENTTTEETSTTTSETSTTSVTSVTSATTTQTTTTTTQATTITEENIQQEQNDNNDNNNINYDDNNNNNVDNNVEYVYEDNNNYQDNNANNDNNNDVNFGFNENNNNNNNYQEPEPEVQPETEPEPTYVYNDGTFTGTAYGYDGDVQITITIEHDVITSIDGYSTESDPWYFEQASASVYQQILANQNPNVDAVSGATYSSNAIMSAVQSALNSARK